MDSFGQRRSGGARSAVAGAMASSLSARGSTAKAPASEPAQVSAGAPAGLGAGNALMAELHAERIARCGTPPAAAASVSAAAAPLTEFSLLTYNLWFQVEFLKCKPPFRSKPRPHKLHCCPATPLFPLHAVPGAFQRPNSRQASRCLWPFAHLVASLQENVMLVERMQGVSDIVAERMPHFLCFQVGWAPRFQSASSLARDYGRKLLSCLLLLLLPCNAASSPLKAM